VIRIAKQLFSVTQQTQPRQTDS